MKFTLKTAVKVAAKFVNKILKKFFNWNDRHYEAAILEKEFSVPRVRPTNRF